MKIKVSRRAELINRLKDFWWLANLNPRAKKGLEVHTHHHDTHNPVNHHPKAERTLALVNPVDFTVMEVMRCNNALGSILSQQPIFVDVPENEQVFVGKSVWNDELRVFAQLEQMDNNSEQNQESREEEV